MKRPEVKTLTAAQRLEGLETSVGMLDSALGNMMQNLNMIRESLFLLNDKVDAMIVAGERGQPISKASVETLMVEAKVGQLKAKVDHLVSRGIIEKADSVGFMSFIVGRELNKDSGEVTNPRIQFTLASLNDTAKGRLLEKKVGDSVVLSDESPIALEIEEIFTIVQQAEPQAEPEQTAPSQAEPVIVEAEEVSAKDDVVSPA